MIAHEGRGSPTIQRRVIVEGEVQGVGFRAFVQRQVTALGVAMRGFVRNLRDGRVEAVFCGPQDAVLRMAEWCRRGPPGARVLTLTVQEEAPDPALAEFEIVRDR